jgi:hypothetical protein
VDHITATKDLQINNLPCVVHTRNEPKVPRTCPWVRTSNGQISTTTVAVYFGNLKLSIWDFYQNFGFVHTKACA